MIFFVYLFQNVEQKYLRGKVSLNEATQTMDTNPIKTAITVCSELIRKQVKNEILRIVFKMCGRNSFKKKDSTAFIFGVQNPFINNLNSKL